MHHTVWFFMLLHDIATYKDRRVCVGGGGHRMDMPSMKQVLLTDAEIVLYAM